MALSKATEIRALSDQELADGIVAIKRDLFNLRLEKAVGRLEKTHQFKHARHKLAQMMTVEHERKTKQALEATK
jgi:large subunit ribosomal protein L29